MSNGKASGESTGGNSLSSSQVEHENAMFETPGEARDYRQESIRIQREAFYWRQQAEQRRQKIDQLQNELGLFYRGYAHRARILLMFLRQHKRILIPLVVIGLLCLLIAPVLLLLLIIPAGREVLMNTALRVSSLRELMEMLSEHKTIAENKTRGKVREQSALIMRRLPIDPAKLNQSGGTSHCMLHLDYLSPHSRYQLGRLGLATEAGDSSSHANIVRSLSRSEVSLQRASFACLARSSGQE
jgi:hypothetical protein